MEQVVYTKEVNIPAETYDRVMRLFEIEDMAEMTDQELVAAGAQEYYCENIFRVAFEDGVSVSYTLRSDAHNYWGDLEWDSPDGMYDSDCVYDFDDIEGGRPRCYSKSTHSQTTDTRGKDF